MNLTAEIVVQIVSYVAVAGAIYGGIRADLKAMHQRLDRVSASADKAHSRLDTLLLEHNRMHGPDSRP